LGPRVTVILINYNGAAIGDVIARSVQAVNNQTYTDWEVVLVDDGSTDGSDVLLQSLADGERVFFTRTDQHRGVGAARNAGITLARGEYLAFLDNDAIPEPDWLAEIVKKMDEHPGYGACASRVMFFDRPDTINSLGSVLNELAHGTGVGMHELKSFYRPTGEIMYATGNGMVLRRSALDVIGGFDEGFRFYGHDDSDIGIRLRNAGYAIVQQPSAVVLHLHSTSKRQPGMPFWDQRNRIRFVLKHYAWWEVLWFTCHDLPLHLRLHNLAIYIKVWLSALSEYARQSHFRTSGHTIRGAKGWRGRRSLPVQRVVLGRKLAWRVDTLGQSCSLPALYSTSSAGWSVCASDSSSCFISNFPTIKCLFTWRVHTNFGVRNGVACHPRRSLRRDLCPTKIACW